MIALTSKEMMNNNNKSKQSQGLLSLLSPSLIKVLCIHVMWFVYFSKHQLLTLPKILKVSNYFKINQNFIFVVKKDKKASIKKFGGFNNFFPDI